MIALIRPVVIPVGSTSISIIYMIKLGTKLLAIATVYLVIISGDSDIKAGPGSAGLTKIIKRYYCPSWFGVTGRVIGNNIDQVLCLLAQEIYQPYPRPNH